MLMAYCMAGVDGVYCVISEVMRYNSGGLTVWSVLHDLWIHRFDCMTHVSWEIYRFWLLKC
jgi:hypothetical protein